VSSVASTWAALLGLSTDHYCNDIAWDGTYIYAVFGMVNVENKNVYRINPATGVGTLLFTCADPMTTVYRITIDPSGDIWVGTDTVIQRYSIAGVLKQTFKCESYSGYNSLFWRNSGGVSALYGVQEGSYTISVVRLEPHSLGTRTLLASPVTKTNLQTMKITYQFDFV
jgi:hypothetical protein